MTAQPTTADQMSTQPAPAPSRRLILDSGARTLRYETSGQSRELPLYSEEAFELLTSEWLRVGWNQKHIYTFSWFGRPIIQLPEDLIRIQEVIYRVRPDVILETGIAHGGSLVYYATLCKAMGVGRVIGVDIEIRPHNRRAIEAHELVPLITLVEGSSVDPVIVRSVHTMIAPGERTLVILDSNHTKAHVLGELEAYAPLVAVGSYLVAQDGIAVDLADLPRGKAAWTRDNPKEAVREFTARHPEFVIEQPPWPFNESRLSRNVTHWPDAYLRRVR